MSLGHQPPVHGHRKPDNNLTPETLYPLHLVVCPDCWLVQLDYAVDPTILFPPEYPYNTGATNMLVQNFKILAQTVVRDYQLATKKLVIDIGSNDGTLLQAFKDQDMDVLGVEPTDVADLANSRGLTTRKEFFTESLAHDIAAHEGRAAVITSTNVFAHIYDVYGVLAGIKIVLAPDGVFVSESQYLMDIVEKMEFDTIYHEHVRYYALKPLAELFRRAGFSLVDAERISAAGGSIRVFAKVGSHPMSTRVQELIAAEEAAGVYNLQTWEKFAARALQIKRELMTLLLDLKKSGARIVGLGAPGRSNTLLNFIHIDDSILDYAGERNTSPKIGLLSPGMHIPIVDEARILTDQPEYCLVLSWHIGEELMQKTRGMGYNGKFILPLPKPHVV